MKMQIFDKRKLRIFLIRNNNLVTFLKLFIVLFLMFFMNLNKKFISCIFYALIWDAFMLNLKKRRFHKYIMNVFILLNILVERLIYIANNYNIANLILSMSYIVVILIIIKLDLIANRVKYNFTLWYDEIRRIIKTYKFLNAIKMIIIISILLLIKVNIMVIIFIGILNLLQLFIGNSEVDRIKKPIMDLFIFYISALAIIFKADANIIIENADMIAILGILATISFYWILNKKE